jgi:RimJ/RimL family protein N-acetyltransferase
VSELSRAKNGKFLEVLSEADDFEGEISSSQSWRPGQKVQLVSPRVELTTLTEDDLVGYGESDVPEWFGSDARRKYVWLPNLKPLEYLRGLVAATDQTRKFAFLISAKGTLIGLLKGNVILAEERLQLVPTTVIGNENYSGRGLGTEAGDLLIWFAITRLDVSEIERRIYEDNEGFRLRLEKAGYVAAAVAEEAQLDGSVRRYLTYKITSKNWLERNQSAVESFRISPAEGSRKIS